MLCAFDEHYGNRMAARIEFDIALLQYAGADYVLMPSGLTLRRFLQVSMRYGTLPIVRETAVCEFLWPYNSLRAEGTGFSLLLKTQMKWQILCMLPICLKR